MKVVTLPSEKVNLVYTTDWHLSDIPPGRRRDSYRTAILDKINFTRELTEKVKGVGVCGADVFHYKNPKHPANSVGLVVEILRCIRRFPTGCIYGAVGNHDLYFDRMDSLPDQPLGLLIATGTYHNLVEESVLFTNQEKTFGVLVDSFPYEHDSSNNISRVMNPPPRPPLATYRVGVIHQYGQEGNRGSLYGAPIIGYNEVADSDYDFLLWGHDHSRKETATVGNTTHINLGSLARAALPTDTDNHPPVATLLSFSERGAYRPKEILIPCNPLEAAFAVADKGVENVSKTEEIAAYFESMDSVVDGIESGDMVEVLTNLAQGDTVTLNMALQLCQ